MPLSKDDRIAFSGQIIGTDAQVAGIASAKVQLQAQIAKIQSLDTANKNLFDPVNALVNGYQGEYNMLDGNLRSTIIEQDIQNSAGKKLQNHFFPNDTSITVPSLSGSHNIWPQVTPFALTYAIGKNYTEGYGSTASEVTAINAILAQITTALSNPDFDNTTGTSLSGTCSNPTYTDQATCVFNGGTWTPGLPYVTDPTIHALVAAMITNVNSLLTFLATESSAIVTTDTNPTNSANNTAAKNNINSTFIPALNSWLSNSDFEVTGAGPSKLHITQLTALQTALNNRLSFITTRKTQLAAVLGTIVQNVSDGTITSQSGMYGIRYSFLSLRLNAFGGSLTQLASFQTASMAQDAMKANLLSSKATYASIVPTTALKSNAANSAIVHVVDPSFLSQGDTVYLYAETQEELLCGVVSIQGDMVILTQTIPAKYTTSIKARIYKDLT